MNGRERGGTGADLVGQGGQAEFDAFPRITLGLPVQGLMLAKLLEEDRRQKVRPGSAAWSGMERGRSLRDLLAVATCELLAHRLDHLPLP